MSTEHFAEIIREAATSPLGILALIVLLLGSLAVVFFGKSSEKARLTVWGMAFGGALLFGFAILSAEQGPAGGGQEVPPAPASGGGNVVEQDRPSSASDDPPSAASGEQPVAPSRAAIQISYAGDPYGCQLPLTIAVGDRSFAPQGHLARLEDVPLGTQPYQIYGVISCPSLGGACAVDSEGAIEVAAGRTYHLVWQYMPDQSCAAELRTSL